MSLSPFPTLMVKIAFCREVLTLRSVHPWEHSTHCRPVAKGGQRGQTTPPPETAGGPFFAHLAFLQNPFMPCLRNDSPLWPSSKHYDTPVDLEETVNIFTRIHPRRLEGHGVVHLLVDYGVRLRGHWPATVRVSQRQLHRPRLSGASPSLAASTRQTRKSPACVASWL